MDVAAYVSVRKFSDESDANGSDHIVRAWCSYRFLSVFEPQESLL